MIESSGEKKKSVASSISDPNIVDVDLGYVEKKKFRINGDNDRMLELNVSDINIVKRLSDAYPKLTTFMKEVQAETETALADGEDAEQLERMAKFLADIDAKMRSLVDYIFDSNVSEVCAPSGNMFDPVNGEYRFEHILNVISKLYTNGLESELAALRKNVSKHTSKYAKKYHK